MITGIAKPFCELFIYVIINLCKTDVKPTLHQHCGKSLILERITGIEPVSRPWEGRILPLNHIRKLFFKNITYPPQPNLKNVF